MAELGLNPYHPLVLQIIVVTLGFDPGRDDDELGHIYYDFCVWIYSLYQNDPDQKFALAVWDRRWFFLHPELYDDASARDGL